MRALGILALASAAVLGGCASGVEGENQVAIRAATRALEGFMSAVRDGDCKAAHAAFSWRSRAERPLAAFEADYAAHREYFQRMAAGKVSGGQYDGFSVILKVLNGQGGLEFVSMIPEDRGWHVDAMGRNYPDVVAQRPGR